MKMYKLILIADLFIIVKIWKQPVHPSTDKCLNKLWYIHIREYNSTIKEINYQTCNNSIMISERNHMY